MPRLRQPNFQASAVLVAALGYFVDVYDLILFSVVRRESLQELGVNGANLLSDGLYLLNSQMLGMLLGGVLWGVLGDKVGRLSVLFGSILTYSIANIANGFVHSLEQYSLLRFVAGVGLAGELGAGVVLVVESLPARLRGYGTTIIATVGVSGAVAAALVGGYTHWRTAYVVGGVLGLLLLVLRISVRESEMFHSAKDTEVPRGKLALLLASPERFKRFVSCIIAGLPIWFTVGILVTLAPEFGKAFGLSPLPTAGDAVLWTYVGLVVGDLISGLLSQQWESRRKVITTFIIFTFVGITLFLSQGWFASTLTRFYGTCTLMGLSVGYWAVLVTTAAEQFGTNMRATAATTVPNLIRGAVVPVSWLFQSLVPHLQVVGSGAAVGTVCILLGLVGARGMAETFHRDLDFQEE